jgi:tetratricopeptide (TPR) repeat protein
LCLENLQKYEEAIASYEKAIIIQPKYYPAWNNLGLALSNLQRYQEAIISYDKAISINPDDAHSWYNRGISLYYIICKDTKKRLHLSTKPLPSNLMTINLGISEVML